MPEASSSLKSVSTRRARVVRAVRTAAAAAVLGIAGIATAGQPVPHGQVPAGSHGGDFAGTSVHRSPAKHQARELRRRGPDQVLELRRRSGDQVRGLGGPAPQQQADRPAPSSPRLPDNRLGPVPVVAAGVDTPDRLEPSRAACLLDDRTVCLASGAGTFALWCARRHLVFDMPASKPARRAACPESAIEAVWLRSGGDRAASRIEPGPCPAVPACSGDPGPETTDP